MTNILSNRAKNALINTFEEFNAQADFTDKELKRAVSRLTVAQLRAIPNCGPRSIAEIREWLRDDGLFLSAPQSKLDQAAELLRRNGYEVIPPKAE